MVPVKVGDYVKIADREATSVDLRSGLFYNYFRNLTGTVERIYDDNTVCVDVEIDSLPEDIKQRHLEIQEGAKNKWISGLSQEQQRKLSEEDKQFKMNYKVLVAKADVEPAKKSAKPKAETVKQKKADTVVEPEPSTAAKKATKTEPKASAKSKEGSEQKRVTEKDLEAAEEAYLKSLQAKDGK